MVHCVAKATPIQFIDGNKLNSFRTGLTNHTWPISYHIMLLLINVLEGRHTDACTHTDMQTKMVARSQVCAAKGYTRTV